MPSVAARFGRAALTYEGGADLHRRVAAHLMTLLPAPGEVHGILEVGCGTGILSRLIRARYPEATFCMTDLAERMVKQARGDSHGALCFVADGRNLATRARFDLVVCSSALHWMTPLAGTVANLAGLLRTGGRLAVAAMVAGTLDELHSVRRRLIPGKTPPGALPEVADIADAVAAAGLTDMRRQVETLKICYPSATAFLRTLHDQGLTGGTVSAAKRPLTRGELRDLTAEYDRAWGRTEGGVFASYRVAYVVATAGGET